MGGATKDVLIVPFFGQGHLFPCAELCRHISSYNCNSIFIIPSHLSSSIPSDLHHHPSIELVQIESSEETLPPDGEWPAPGLHHHRQLGQGIESFLSRRFENVGPPAFVVMDVMMNWSKHIFKKAIIPIVSSSPLAPVQLQWSILPGKPMSITSGLTRPECFPGCPRAWCRKRVLG